MGLGAGWIITIVVIVLVIAAIIAGGSNPNHCNGGGKFLGKSKKNFGLIGLFLILGGGLMFSNYINL